MKDVYGRHNAKAVKKLCAIADKIEALDGAMQQLTDAELRAKTDEFKKRLKGGATTDDILVEAFAVCREAASRVLHQKHYYVQLLGGIALHQGRVSQMLTGEGKTLVETLPAYLNALTGNGVHIVTVNEYLAKRDAEWMGKVFNFLGLSVGVTLARIGTVSKKRAYLCDITYGTNSEFGFDYLRDNMVRSCFERVQRGLNFAIVDEVDSILIDEARTPLIISGPSSKSSKMYQKADAFAVRLKNSTNVDNEGNLLDGEKEPNGDYTVDMKSHQVMLTDRGVANAERYFGVENLGDGENIELNYYINNALRAHGIMRKNVDYIVENKKVIIVDEFTGRKMIGRRYNGGLHQAIEAKEHVTIEEENVTAATITYQNYFRMYHKLSGMTGTAKTEEEEFNQIYNLDVVCIPTNMPVKRIDDVDLVYMTRKAKLNAIVEKVKQVHQTGQPILIGTPSVEKSDELSDMLMASGVAHDKLNAKNHEREAEIIAQAGKLGAVTIATNMAGRGTDIMLGGNPETMARRQMLSEGYEPHAVEIATGFSDGGNEEVKQLQQHFRELFAEYKKQTDQEKVKVIDCGGLFVIGSERHESRRIDDQLRGRSGRQGEPGRSVFFVSLEDDLMRIFGDAMTNVMSTFGWDENVPISNRLFHRNIETAQKRVEGRNFSIRKRVIQYDDVNNYQRKIIYGQRNKALDGEDVHADIVKSLDVYARKVLEVACHGVEDTEEWDFDEVNKLLKINVGFDHDVLGDDVNSAKKAVEAIRAEAEKLLQHTKEEAESVLVGHTTFADVERLVLLQVTDRFWMRHIEDIEELKNGVGLQAIGQKDPLVVFKREAFDMFENMTDNIVLVTVNNILRLDYQAIYQTEVDRKEIDTNPNKSMNRPCPCGSGKKYKDCCYLKENKSLTPKAKDEQPLDPKKEEYRLKREARKAEKEKK